MPEVVGNLSRSGQDAFQNVFPPKARIEDQAIANAATTSAWGMAWTVVTAATAAAMAITNYLTMRPRQQQTIASAGGMTERRSANAHCSRRAVGGGFKMIMEFGFIAAPADARWFFGLSAVGTAMTNVNPSTLLNLIGFGKDTADANFTLMSNDGAGAATKTALPNTGNSASIVNSTIILELACTPGQAGIDYKVTEISSTGAVTTDSGTIAADLPAIDTLFFPHMWGCSVTAVAHTWQYIRYLCELG